MSDNLEDILRRSLDAAERRRIGALAIGILMVLFAGAVILFHIASDSAALLLWTGGLALLIVSIILRSTRLILKAIDTLADRRT
jgi:hypothetical protein